MLAHGVVILNKMSSDFHTFKCKTHNSSQILTPLKHLIWTTDSTIIKCANQGSLTVKRRTVFTQKNHRHLPSAGVKDTLF